MTEAELTWYADRAEYDKDGDGPILIAEIRRLRAGLAEMRDLTRDHDADCTGDGVDPRSCSCVSGTINKIVAELIGDAERDRGCAEILAGIARCKARIDALRPELDAIQTRIRSWQWPPPC